MFVLVSSILSIYLTTISILFLFHITTMAITIFLWNSLLHSLHHCRINLWLFLYCLTVSCSRHHSAIRHLMHRLFLSFLRNINLLFSFNKLLCRTQSTLKLFKCSLIFRTVSILKFISYQLASF